MVFSLLITSAYKNNVIQVIEFSSMNKLPQLSLIFNECRICRGLTRLHHLLLNGWLLSKTVWRRSSIGNQAGLALIFKEQTKQHFHERRKEWKEGRKEGGNIFHFPPSGFCFSTDGEVFDAGMKSGACKARGSSCLRGKVKWAFQECRAPWKSAQRRLHQGDPKKTKRKENHKTKIFFCSQ